MAEKTSDTDPATDKGSGDTVETNVAEAVGTEPSSDGPDIAAVKAAVASDSSDDQMPVKAASTDTATKSDPSPRFTTKNPATRAKPTGRKASIRKNEAKKPSVKKPTSSEPTPTETAKPVTTISQLKDKIMATAPNDFTSPMNETASDMRSKLTSAYEKSTEMTKEVADFHKSNFDAVVQSSKLFAAGMQDMSQTAMESVKGDAETMTDDIKKMAAVKNPAELFELQGEIARRNLDTLVARTSQGAEAWMKLANEAFAPLSSRASVAMDKMKSAA